MPAEPAIEVRDLTKVFGALRAVDGITLRVDAGEIVGFLGPNGAGKTTTMRILAGIFPPTTGTVRIAGRDPEREPLACRRAVGYFPEYAPFYPDLDVERYLGFVARLKRVPRRERRARVAEVLAACGLEGVARRRVGNLSKGYRQRVGLAQALCGDPEILVLDEPTIGLDPGQVVEIRDLVRALRGRRTVFFSSHILSEVEALCERVIVIARGRLVAAGTPRELAAQLGGRVRVVVRADGPSDAVAAALSRVPGLVRLERGADGFVLETTGEADGARAAGDAVRAGGWAVLELREERLDLEEIFLRLVERGGPRG
ncbi:MAG TPA: ABC transporter ATP-binding protein [Candidatus Binatia bacterium]|jgi:ABC-2 type transport system ATP-binding protein|nr:ABC transporter ATP-binding protein [Candidatus Binatia bacterium]